MLRRPGRGHLFGPAFAQTVLTALTFAVWKGTDRGIEDEVAPATTRVPPPPRLDLGANRKNGQDREPERRTDQPGLGAGRSVPCAAR
jgi:hypothetical protein